MYVYKPTYTTHEAIRWTGVNVSEIYEFLIRAAKRRVVGEFTFKDNELYQRCVWNDKTNKYDDTKYVEAGSWLIVEDNDYSDEKIFTYTQNEFREKGFVRDEPE